MGIRQYKPTSAGRRAGMVSDFADMHRPAREQAREVAARPQAKKGGRNNQGIITSRFRGGGHKQMYRIIDFKRTARRRLGHGHPGRVRPEPLGPHRADPVPRDEKHERDLHPRPGRPEGRRQGDLRRDEAVEPKLGNCMPLRKIPLGMTVHNVEMQPGRGGQICRSRRVQRHADRPREGAGRRSPCPPARCAACRASAGRPSASCRNAEHMNISLGKAGRKRWMGRKPHNRGTS